MAPVFPGEGWQAAVRWTLGVSGVPCLARALGPLVGDVAPQRIGIVVTGSGFPPAASCCSGGRATGTRAPR